MTSLSLIFRQKHAFKFLKLEGSYICALYGKIGKQKYCNFWKEQIFWKLFSDLESARRDLPIGINKRKKWCFYFFMCFVEMIMCFASKNMCFNPTPIFFSIIYIKFPIFRHKELNTWIVHESYSSSRKNFTLP